MKLVIICFIAFCNIYVLKSTERYESIFSLIGNIDPEKKEDGFSEAVSGAKLIYAFESMEKNKSPDEIKGKFDSFDRNIKSKPSVMKKIELLYERMHSDQEKQDFADEIFRNSEVYGNLLQSDISEDETLKLYNYLKNYDKEESLKLPKNVFSSAFFRFILQTFGVDGLIRMKDVLVWISDQYKKLPEEIRKILEEIAERIGKNAEKIGLTDIIKLILEEMPEIEKELNSNIYLKSYIKGLTDTSKLVKKEDAGALKENGERLIKDSPTVKHYYKLGTYVQENLLSSKTTDGIKQKGKSCLDCLQNSCRPANKT